MRLSNYEYRRIGPGLELEHIPSGKTQWLQGEDADDLESRLDGVWKQAQWKKMGWDRASRTVDSTIEDYFE